MKTVHEVRHNHAQKQTVCDFLDRGDDWHFLKYEDNTTIHGIFEEAVNPGLSYSEACLRI